MAKASSKGSKTVSASKLSEGEVIDALRAVPEWAELGDQIQRTYHFKNFVDSMNFAQRVAQVAEVEQHHPDILIRYSKVTLSLSTHDAGGLTSKDFAAAAKFDALAGK